MGGVNAVRVVLVDDECLLRSGLALILDAAPDLQVVASVDGGEAVAAVREHSPDLVLLDVRMPPPDGFEVLSLLQAEPEPPQVAMLTTFHDADQVDAALRAGASGFLLKDTEPEQLIAHVRSLAAGARVLARGVDTGELRRPEVSRSDAAVLASLSRRDLCIASAVAAGWSNAEIVERCGLPLGTVKDVVRRLLASLGVSTRVEAAVIVDRAGVRQGA